MASFSSRRRFYSVEEALELILASDDSGESGAESFLTDDELCYQEGLDPVEDDDKVEQPSTSNAAQPPIPPASTQAGAGDHITPQGRGHGWLGARSRSPPPSRGRSRSRARQAQGRGRGIARSRSPRRPHTLPVTPATSWKTENDPDIPPMAKRFIPARPPGHQLNSSSTYTPLDLFKLFFSDATAQTLCRHTNTKAAEHIARGKKYSWTDLTIQEFFKYVGLTFLFSLVKLDNIVDYWRKNTIFSLPFPQSIMTRDRYRIISWNIHMSDPDQDVENDRKKGTPDHDRLFRLKPLMDNIKDACKSFYHPRQNISIDERMVATKAHTGMTQYMKAKPTKWGFKLFVLADSSTGYTLDFNIYTGKSKFTSGVGLAYDSVMSLMNPSFLGSGYRLFVDNFYTSPRLFRDLYSQNIGACGTYRENRKDCPHSDTNALKKKDPRGSIRWIRNDPILFVKWMDTREVAVCSTIHEAYSGSTVRRRVKTANGGWDTKAITCPTPVIEYNKHMGGVDLSDQLIQYYSVHHKTMHWYRTLFLHFLDIAATNSYLLHKELCKEKQEEAMTHKSFLQELTAQLCGCTVAVPPTQARSDHVPVSISEQLDPSKRASYGRRTCIHCRQTRGATQPTPWKCKACGVALCLIPGRNCFEAWHL